MSGSLAIRAIYGPFVDGEVLQDGSAFVAKSAARYIELSNEAG
jgi:hypothetical protein